MVLWIQGVYKTTCVAKKTGRLYQMVRIQSDSQFHIS